MTAELIVMNKNGLALAADSAVTISSGTGPAKIYNTANKLFTLSKYHPIGVMVYGSAEIMGLPWETVIKRYLDTLGNTSYPSVDGYVDSLFEYLEKVAFPPECYAEYVKQRTVELFGVVATEIDNRVETRIKEEDGIEESAIETIHSTVVSEAHKRIIEEQKSLKIRRSDISESLEKHRPAVRKIIETLLENRPIKGPVKRKLIDASLLMAIVFPGINQSGLVIAGFGRDDVFPSTRAFEIHKILDGQVQFELTFSRDISLTDYASVRAFAQANETQNFMNGLSDRISGYINNDLKDILAGALVDEVTDLLVKDGVVAANKSDQCKQRLASAGQGVHAYVRRSVSDISQREFWGPVVSAVTFFSPSEMASMAETLVSLESFRQQVTLRSETVGGPVDVAVITRGDGFIWIKRKHYFDRELNHQFFANYNRLQGEEDDNQDDR